MIQLLFQTGGGVGYLKMKETSAQLGRYLGHLQLFGEHYHLEIDPLTQTSPDCAGNHISHNRKKDKERDDGIGLN